MILLVLGLAKSCCWIGQITQNKVQVPHRVQNL